MTHQHEQLHDGSATTPAVTTDSELAPGRASRTAGLVGPSGPRPSGLLMRKAARDGNNVAADADAAVGAAASSTGSALPDDLRGRFEGSLGTDLSGVRVHTGPASAEAASAVGAKAYTLGNDIHFGAGHFDTSSLQGQHLLAHEVAHTVQQRGGSPTRQHKLEVSSPGDAFEHEADHAASAMVTGAPTAVGIARGGVARGVGDVVDAVHKGQEAAKGANAKLSKDGIELDSDLMKISVDWKEKVKGSVTIHPKPAKWQKTVSQELVSAYKVVGIQLIGQVEAKFTPQGEFSATGEFEHGKGGSVSITGSATALGEVTGSVKIGPYLGLSGKANINANVAAALSGSASAKVTGFGTISIAPDGTPTIASVGAVVSADIKVDLTESLEIGTTTPDEHGDQEQSTLMAIELHKQPAGTASGSAMIMNTGGVTSMTAAGEFKQELYKPAFTPAKTGAGAAFQKVIKNIKIPSTPAQIKAADDKREQELRQQEDEDTQSSDQRRDMLPTPRQSVDDTPCA